MRPVTSSSHAAALPAPSAQHDGNGRPTICKCVCMAPQVRHLDTRTKQTPCEVWGVFQETIMLEYHAFSTGHITGCNQTCMPEGSPEHPGGQPLVHGLRGSAQAVRMHRAARTCQVARCAHRNRPQGHLHISMAFAPTSALCKRGTSRALWVSNPYSPEVSTACCWANSCSDSASKMQGI